MHLWWWLLLVTETAFPIKQRLFRILAKKIQHLFLTMVVPIKCMISWLHAWKMKQKKLNKMKKWICRQAIIFFMSMHPLCQCFPVIFSNNLASILPPYPLLHLERWQKSKIESFFRIVMGKNSIPIENLWFFYDFRRQGEFRG